MAAALRALYSAALTGAVPLYLARLALKARRDPRYLANVGERFARPAPPQADLWIHAVSVGEVASVLPLLGALREQAPQLRLLLTVTTPTGRAHALARVPAGVAVHYLPLDLPRVLGRAFAAVRPRVVMLVEGELWPNLVATAQRVGVPVWSINARLSERSQQRYQRFPALSEALFGGLARVLAQTPDDALRFAQAGVAKDAVNAVGNLKFDALPRGSRVNAETRPLTLALGCLRVGEEDILLPAVETLRAQFPELCVRIVPRQPGDGVRFAEAWRALGATVRHVTEPEAPPPSAGECRVDDVMGGLTAVYAASDVAYVGGALVPLGGHNVAEAAACGCCVLVGPHHDKNRVATRALEKAGTLCVVEDAGAFCEAAECWLEDASERARVVAEGEVALAALAGATAFTVRELAEAGYLT